MTASLPVGDGDIHPLAVQLLQHHLPGELAEKGQLLPVGGPQGHPEVGAEPVTVRLGPSLPEGGGKVTGQGLLRQAPSLQGGQQRLPPEPAGPGVVKLLLPRGGILPGGGDGGGVVPLLPVKGQGLLNGFRE